MMKRVALVSVAALVLAACKDGAPQVPANKLPKDTYFEDMMEFNKGFVEFEMAEIDSFVSANNLDMRQTPSGLRYKIAEEGGAKPESKSVVAFRYTVSLLDGTVCPYIKEKEVVKKLGAGSLEKGFEEALMMLGKGGSGDFIVPSYLAFSVSGYKDCVPSRTPVRCSIELVDIKAATAK